MLFGSRSQRGLRSTTSSRSACVGTLTLCPVKTCSRTVCWAKVNCSARFSHMAQRGLLHTLPDGPSITFCTVHRSLQLSAMQSQRNHGDSPVVKATFDVARIAMRTDDDQGVPLSTPQALPTGRAVQKGLEALP
eukprot:860754-Amphidinium_carterae.1